MDLPRDSRPGFMICQGPPMVQVEPGVWKVMLPLQPGRYQYQLVIDGASRVAVV